MEIIVIGAGAAGILAAIAAAEQGQSVLVVERNRKPLKKLNVTGNGRANILNAGAPLYYGGEAFARIVLAHCGYCDLHTYFESIGVPLREESEGRVYPAALQASVVADALLLRARQLGVCFLYNTQVMGIQKANDRFAIQAIEKQEEVQRSGKRGVAQTGESKAVALHAAKVIVTVGGAAAPAHGTDGGAYPLLTTFGHELTALKPALCALLTDQKQIAGLSGQRIRTKVRLVSKSEQCLAQVEGEVLFGEDAISGIASMQLARFVQPGAMVSLNLTQALLGSMTTDEAPDAVLERLQYLKQYRKDCPCVELLTGTFAPPLQKLLYKQAGWQDSSMLAGQLQPKQLEHLARVIADMRLPVTGTRGFAQAQVTAGGISTADFDPKTMESMRCKGLYAAGEVLDVDGECGGYNLMFAFASGILAGRAAGEKG